MLYKVIYYYIKIGKFFRYPLIFSNYIIEHFDKWILAILWIICILVSGWYIVAVFSIT